MPSISGKYQHYKNEDIEEYFTAVGVPYIARKMMSMSSPIMEISIDGEFVTLKTSSLVRKVELKFKIGEEYEEQMQSIILKNTTKLVNDNELITESILPETGEKCGRHYLFTDEGCIVTLTHDRANKPGKRYFRRVTS